MREKRKSAEIAQSILTASELPEMTGTASHSFIPLVDAAAPDRRLDKGFAARKGSLHAGADVGRTH